MLPGFMLASGRVGGGERRLHSKTPFACISAANVGADAFNITGLLNVRAVKNNN